jgi:hypothetical protein
LENNYPQFPGFAGSCKTRIIGSEVDMKGFGGAGFSLWIFVRGGLNPTG